MGYDRKQTKTMKRTEKYSKETVKDVLDYPFAHNKERGISKTTCKKFGVRMSISEEDGETITAYYFPYYNQQGKICGYKKRDMTLDKDEQYHFTTIGKVGVNCKMFGQQVAESYDRKHKKIIIAEGEWDVLAVEEAAKESNRGTKWNDLRPFVVGINCGTKNAGDCVINNKDFIDSFDEVAIAMDNDKASEVELRKGIKKGKEATEDIASIFIGSTVKVLSYTGTEDCKDPNDILLKYGSDKLNSLISFNFKKHIAEKVVTAEDIGFENFIKDRPEGVYVETFPKLMEKIHGFRKRELVVITAPSNAGKTSCTAEIAYKLAEKGHRIAQIYLEEETSETLQRNAARYLETNYNYFKKSPTKHFTKEQLQEAFEWTNDKFIYLDHFGSIKIEELINKIKTFVYQYKVDFVILDHLSMLVSQLADNNERLLLDKVMTELAAFVASHDVGIIAVSHLNRSVAEEFKAPKGKEDKPFWVSVRKESLRGSASLEQLAWIVLGLEPEIMPDKSRGRVRWSVLKNRPWGYLGIGDTFQMNDQTGLMELAEDIEETSGEY